MKAEQNILLTGEAIRSARTLVRISRKELANLAKVSVDTVKRLEKTRGAVRANSETLSRIIRAFAGMGLTLRNDGRSSEIILNYPASELEGGIEVDHSISDLYRLTYISRAALEIEGNWSAIEEICETSKRRNHQLGVTGALWFQDGYFLQSIEGPKSSLQALAGMLALDQRHRCPMVLENSRIQERLFGLTMMCHSDRPADLLGVPKLSYDISAESALALLRSLTHSGQG